VCRVVVQLFSLRYEAAKQIEEEQDAEIEEVEQRRKTAAAAAVISNDHSTGGSRRPLTDRSGQADGHHTGAGM